MSEAPLNLWGVVVAGGRGQRFGAPKHLAALAGKSLWEWARDALVEGGARQVIVVGDVPGGVEGGSERRWSVARGLARIGEDDALVAVHDAARPLASPSLLKRLCHAVIEQEADGAIPVVPIPDSIKRVDQGTGRVVETLDRAEIMAAQTPQVFRSAILRRAHLLPAETPASDDASMVEAVGGRVVVVPGERRAGKITYPEDLKVAEATIRLSPDEYLR